jgi:hypothetical protein
MHIHFLTHDKSTDHNPRAERGSASRYGSPRFKSGLEETLFWLTFVVNFVSPYRKHKKISQLGHDHFCSHLNNYINVLLLEAKHC